MKVIIDTINKTVSDEKGLYEAMYDKTFKICISFESDYNVREGSISIEKVRYIDKVCKLLFDKEELE